MKRLQKIEKKERQKIEREAKMLQKKKLRDKAAVDKEARISRRKESREDKKKAKKDDQKSNKLARHALKETRSGYAYYTPCTLPKLKTITIKDLIAHEVIHHKDFDATIDNCRQKLKRMNSVPQKHDAKSHDPESPKKFNGRFAPNLNNLGSPNKNGRSEIRSMADILQPCPSDPVFQNQTMFLKDKDHMNDLRVQDPGINKSRGYRRNGENSNRRDRKRSHKKRSRPVKKNCFPPKSFHMSINDLMSGVSHTFPTNRKIMSSTNLNIENCLQKRGELEFMQDFSIDFED